MWVRHVWARISGGLVCVGLTGRLEGRRVSEHSVCDGQTSGIRRRGWPEQTPQAGDPQPIQKTQLEQIRMGCEFVTNVALISSHWFCHSFHFYYCSCLVTKLCPTLWNPMNCSMPGFPVLHRLPELAQIYVHWVSDAIERFHPLLFSSPFPSIFPSIRVFSNESALHIRWPKYWSFSFSISSSNEYPGLISFRIDWLDLLAVQRTLKSLLQHYN